LREPVNLRVIALIERALMVRTLVALDLIKRQPFLSVRGIEERADRTVPGPCGEL